jgi:Arc/MetJ-type ribon-helix-helix transcriptional regulator
MSDLQSEDPAGEPSRGAEDRQAVELPSRVVDRVDERVRVTDFESAAEYVTFVLRETLARVESEGDDETAADSVSEADVQERLESLGYLE